MRHGKKDSALLDRVLIVGSGYGPESGFLETGRLKGDVWGGLGGFGFLGLACLVVSTISLRL